jgi:hypothetical protein
MVWQLCVSQGLVSSVAPDSSMTFKYPVEISRDVLSMTHQFSQQAMEVQGVGFVSFLPSFIILDHPSSSMFCRALLGHVASRHGVPS